MAITIVFSNLTLNKGIYFLKVTLNKTELPNAGQNALFLAGLKVFKLSTFLPDLDVSFWCQPIKQWNE